ncbi:hypothetical protein [Flexivirga meconopsidis]|uniref:hypothetical protein n=1 Tax=Flexivirga meconopsidis TaxID=2977121 RepID=UPI002240DF8E|nr:hypothetical protein [Flexivirga meconopsidis]
MAEEFETRTVLSLRTGTKICVLIALGFVVAAVYFYFVPVTSVRTQSGSVFGCGSASSPMTGGFAEGACGKITDVYKYRAIACIVLALLTAIVGGLLFGADRRQETRAVRTDVDRHDDRHDEGDRDRDGERSDSRATGDRDQDDDRPRYDRGDEGSATDATAADHEQATTRAQLRDSDGKRY